MTFLLFVLGTYSDVLKLIGSASKSNNAIYQRLRAIVNTPWYIKCERIHNDLRIPAVMEIIHDKAFSHHRKLESNSNLLLQPLLENYVIRRLKMKWPTNM